MRRLPSIIRLAIVLIAGMSPPLFWTQAQTKLFKHGLAQPTKIFVTQQRTVLLLDRETNTVRQYELTGKELNSAGGYGWSDTGLDRPSGVTSDGLVILVADYGNHRIRFFDRTLSPLRSLSTRDTSVAQARFGFPTDIVLSRFGDIFLIDNENGRIVKFDARFQFERAFGSIENRLGQVQNPDCLRIMSGDTLLVLDKNVLKFFDLFGIFLGSSQLPIEEAALSIAQLGGDFFVLTSTALYRLQSGRALSVLETVGTEEKYLDMYSAGGKLFLLSTDRVLSFSLP